MTNDRTSVRVGAVVLVGLALAVVAVLVGQGRHFRSGVALHVGLERVGNLQIGGKVRLAGLVLGEVEDIRFAGGATRAQLDLWIERRHFWLLTETTDFFVGQEGLLGEPYLGVAARPGEPGRPLEPGALVRGIDPPRIDHLLITVAANLRAANELIRVGFPEGAALGAALDELARTVDGLDTPAAAWLSGLRLLGEARALTVDVPPGATDRILDLATNLEPPPFSDQLRRLGVQLDRLALRADDPRLARFSSGLAGAAELVAHAQHALAMAEELRAVLESGRSSLGAFMTDLELADEMKAMTKAMKRQPWNVLGKNPK